MKKIRWIIIITLIFSILSGCSKKDDQSDKPISEVKTTELSDRDFLSVLKIQDHTIYIYQPEDIMRGDIINYGYSAPLLMVFGNGKLDEEEAVNFIKEKGIDKIAQKNGGFVIFVNPKENWDKEEHGIYEAILKKTAVAQEGFSHGLLYDRKTKEYSIFASPAATCLYGYGKGADYIAGEYIKEVSGMSSMSSLGSDDITITAAILEKLEKAPYIQDRNIIIVSLNNDTSIDKEAGKFSDHYHTGTGSFDRAYEEYVAGYQRWNGKLIETFYPDMNGISMEALVFEVNTSPDNAVIKAPTYQLGAVVFTRKDSKADKRPLLLCFHGGGDTAITTASIAGWPKIAAENDLILCAIEMHTRTTATETIEVIDKLKQIYDIDESRIYATGFSMGGIKTWDLYQEYPEVFAALSPMGATVNVGKNTQFKDSPILNEEIMVPVFYSGGENSQLNELPYQGMDCANRINYLLRVNKVETPFELSMSNRSQWTDSIYGFEGDIVEELTDDAYPDSLTRIRYYYSEDGNIYTALCSIRNHQHEIRPFTCERAWEFMKQFSRNENKEIIIDNSN